MCDLSVCIVRFQYTWLSSATVRYPLCCDLILIWILLFCFVIVDLKPVINYQAPQPFSQLELAQNRSTN